MTTATKTRKTPAKASKTAPTKKVSGAVKKPAKTPPEASATSTKGVPAPTAKGKGAGAFATRKIKLLEIPEAKVKIAPQARIVLEALDDLGGTAAQSEVIDHLLESGLKTVQTPKRIYTFYRQMLVDNGYIEFV